jgi:hypothetical protein
MLHVSNALLAKPGLQRADRSVHEWGDETGSRIWRGGFAHPVLQRMLESTEALASFLKLGTDVVFAMLRDLVIGETGRRRP